MKLKTNLKVRQAIPYVEMITSNTNTAKNSISTTDMKEFEEKLDKFKAYWLAESEKYAKANLMKIMTEDLDKLKEQVLDLSDGGKRDIQSIENILGLEWLWICLCE